MKRSMHVSYRLRILILSATIVLTANFLISLVAEKQKNIQQDHIPPELIALYERNPETKDFVFGYPEYKGYTGEVYSDEFALRDEVPLLLQWDKRWGYTEYSGEFFALSGCGPTALSMVFMYITEDVKFTPLYIADFAVKNGYSTDGDGSKWSLMSDGAEELGLSSEELPLVERYVTENLQEGNPIICIMGEGDFTTTGHFIVMTDFIDGKIKVNDPNSISRSEKLWEYDDIYDQIKNMWVYKK